ncbi:MAG: hypothetical protein HZA04_08330 [Nitrospinae bacterium]|nr:hypothetical protein [Nitrospinota bacterium]
MSSVKIGKYTLLEKWYQGTGSSVHLAAKEGDHRRYALKVLDGEAAYQKKGVKG